MKCTYADEDRFTKRLSKDLETLFNALIVSPAIAYCTPVND